MNDRTKETLRAIRTILDRTEQTAFVQPHTFRLIDKDRVVLAEINSHYLKTLLADTYGN